MTILGTRPEIIRLSLIIPLLDRYADKHILVHTGQNFNTSLSDIFSKSSVSDSRIIFLITAILR